MSQARTPSLAELRYQNMRDLTRGKITADQHRATNRALRAEYGDEAFEAAALGAVSNHIRTFG